MVGAGSRPRRRVNRLRRFVDGTGPVALGFFALGPFLALWTPAPDAAAPMPPSVSFAELQRVVIPLRLVIAGECDVHGVAAWFDVLFDGSGGQRWLSTAPGLPTTHWCVGKRGGWVGCDGTRADAPTIHFPPTPGFSCAASCGNRCARLRAPS